MSPQNARLEADGFVPFFRSYTKTWIHTVAAAMLTAFGMLTFVHNWFAAFALAAYVIPPIVLYLQAKGHRGDVEAAAASESVADTESSATPESPPKTGSEDDGERERLLDENERTRPASGTQQAGPTDVERADSSASEHTGSSKAERDSSSEAEPAEPSTRSETDARPGTNSRPEPAAADASASGAAGTDRESSAETDHRPAARPGGTESDEGPESEGGTRDESRDEPDPHPDDISEDDAAGDEEAHPDWRAVEAPTDATLHDVVVTDARGAYAVGDGGIVLARAADRDGEWTVVLEDGPAAGGNDLRGTDATADGGAVWVAGDSGSLGRIDPETGRHVDYTAPAAVTDNWLGVAVGGSSGGETVLLINGSGAVLRGEYDGGDLEWTGPDKPGSGSSFSGVALRADGVGYCCDTNDGVYETTDGGESFERVGLEGADGTLTDVATAGRGDCLVSADDGVVHRYDGPTWTPERVADDAVSGIARRDELAVACADDAIYERDGPAADWKRFELDGDALHAVSIGAARAVAVGADGTVLERE